MTTQEQIAAFFTELMDGLRSRSYARSELTNLEVKQLSDVLAVVGGVGVWYKINGDELQRFGLTYTLRSVYGKWKIVVGAVHDTDIVKFR
jgi:hypothetical protein